MNTDDLHLRRIFTNLKPAGVSVLFAMLFMGGANITGKRLQFVTGYTDKPVSSALQILHAEGFVQPGKTGWSLTDFGRQLPLPETWSRRISDSISIKESFKESDKNTDLILIGESENLRLPEVETEIDETLADALENEKVGEPTKSEIMKKVGLTGLHVIRWAKIKRAEVKRKQATDPKAYYSTGLLINALRALPDHPPLPDDPDETQEETFDRYKYTTGIFAEFVNT
jgi:hypothetical protein